MKKLLSTIIIFLIAFATQAYAQSYTVIVNEANGTESISKKELSKIFLKKKTRWNDGVSITPIDLEVGTDARQAFTTDVHDQGIGGILSYWQQAAFSGAGTAPVQKGNDADIIAFVKSNPGAVGYISAETATDGVKVLNVE